MPKKWSLYALSLGALSCTSFVVSGWLMFRAGTVGDVKAASCGDPAAALALENAAVASFSVAMIFMLGAIASLRRVPIGWRIAAGGFFLVCGGPLLWIASIRVEGWGLQWCK